MLKMIALLFIATLCVSATGASYTTCPRMYEKVGCYKEYRSHLKDLLVYDRFNIKWGEIKQFMHHFVCTCEAKIREVNKARNASEQYAGFAVHFWAECYGKTQKQLDALAGRTESKDCTGDQTYTGCYQRNMECVGHAFTDFVYQLTPLSAIKTYRQCDLIPVKLQCDEGKRIGLLTVKYGERSLSHCGAPISVGWKPECETVSKDAFMSYSTLCGNKIDCTVPEWYTDPTDPCPAVKKYVQVTYKCI